MSGSFGFFNYRYENGLYVPVICVPQEGQSHKRYSGQYNMFVGKWESSDGHITLNNGRKVRNSLATAMRETKEEGFPTDKMIGQFEYMATVNHTPIYAFRIKPGTSRQDFVSNNETVGMNYFPVASYCNISPNYEIRDINGINRRVSKFHIQTIMKCWNKIIKFQ